MALDNKSIATVGNPPYSLAVKFFNHAAEFSTIIGFIVPKSFKKESIQDRLNRNFHLVSSNDLPPNSFLVNGEEYDVPSCFQIWERRDYQRPVSKKVVQIGFHFVKKDEADIAIRRVGANAGKATDDLMVSESSHYFIILDDLTQRQIFLDALNNHQWEHNNTVGPRSISQGEITKILNGLRVSR